MARGPLTKISVATTVNADEAVAALLAEIFGQSASSYTHADSGRTQASVYLTRAGDWSASKRRQLVSALDGLREAGMLVGPGRISVRTVQHEDWAESWKRHFKPFAIGDALLVKPSWSSRGAKRGQAVLVIDPGLSFGTGQHPTTRFCLEELVLCRPGDGRKTFLDIGIGSGILSIAAAKLGYSKVTGFDHDAEAVRVARANARLNQVSRRVHFRCLDLAALVRGPNRFDVICANLTWDLLLGQQRRILAQLAPGGCLVLAGILHTQFPEVTEAYRAAGLKLKRRQRGGESDG